jgi:hypothetical protein
MSAAATQTNAPAPAAGGLAGPILIDLDETTWKEHLDRTERWLGHVAMVQAEFRTLAESTAARFHEPHLREQLTKVAEAAREHEARVAEMYRIIGRSPGSAVTLAGSAMGKAREALGGLVGAAAGAAGPWRDLHQLFLISLGSLGAFSVAEQLGYALGLPALASTAFDVSLEKFKHHRLIQEFVLEFASIAILYQSDDL